MVDDECLHRVARGLVWQYHDHVTAHVAVFDLVVVKEAEDVRVCLASVDDPEKIEHLCLMLELLMPSALSVLLD